MAWQQAGGLNATSQQTTNCKLTAAPGQHHHAALPQRYVAVDLARHLHANVLVNWELILDVDRGEYLEQVAPASSHQATSLLNEPLRSI